MREIGIATRPLRAVRLQASLPRIVAAVVAVVLVAAGVRVALARPTTTIVSRPVTGSSMDQGEEAFAQSFIHAYLTWSPNDTSQREAALAPYLSNSLSPGGGLAPAGATRDVVGWTSIDGEQHDGSQTLVTVAAQTSHGVVYVDVPVARDGNGFLFVSGYPAFVGAPASDPGASLPPQAPVNDPALQTVVTRAITNYLAGNQANLLADLTPNALVSPPAQHLAVGSTQPPTWVVTGRRVAIQVQASDTGGDTWTLTYELAVKKLDRWFVQSIQVDPTFPGGTS